MSTDAMLLSGGVLVEEADIIRTTIECPHCHHRYFNVPVTKLTFARPGLQCGKCAYVIPWE